jgi:hypothetical protein
VLDLSSKYGEAKAHTIHILVNRRMYSKKQIRKRMRQLKEENDVALYKELNVRSTFRGKSENLFKIVKKALCVVEIILKNDDTMIGDKH